MYSWRYKQRCSLSTTSSLIATTNTLHDKLIYSILRNLYRADFFLVMHGIGTTELSVVNVKEQCVLKFSSERIIKEENYQKNVGQWLSSVRQNLSG
jgi:hypothetical protein